MRAALVRSALSIAGCLTVAASACSGGGPPTTAGTRSSHSAAAQDGDVQTGTARPSGVKLTRSVLSDGCTVLTDDEIKALLPQAQKITRAHQFQAADCGYEITFPGHRFPGAQLGTRIRSWSAGADEAATELTTLRRSDSFAAGPRRPDAARLGADECFDGKQMVLGAPNQITCRKGPVVFSADTGGFLFLEGSSHDPLQKQRAWYYRVVLQIVKTITAKIP
jgi:hypothetical protein